MRGSKMKMIFKPLFVTAALSAASLCCAISHAASVTSEPSTAKLQLVVTTQIYPIANQFPQYRQSSKFIQVYEKPLVRIPLTQEIEEHFTDIKQKNSFFQMATIFNDKLQQIIAYFNGSAQASAQVKMIPNQVSDKKTCNSAKHS